MTGLLGARTRAYLIVGVLALAAAGAGLMVLGRGQPSTEASPVVSTPATTPKGSAPSPAHTPPAKAPSTFPSVVPATPPPAPSAPGSAATPSAPGSAATPSAPGGATAPSHSSPAETSSSDLPPTIRQALASNHVVVIALFDPNAKIDGTALREAAAGAQLAGTTFVPVDVTRDDLTALNERYGVIQDPAVLVLRPPGYLVVRIDGFADRDTVAQAAANASS